MFTYMCLSYIPFKTVVQINQNLDVIHSYLNCILLFFFRHVLLHECLAGCHLQPVQGIFYCKLYHWVAKNLQLHLLSLPFIFDWFKFTQVLTADILQ